MASLLRRPGNLARYSRVTAECAARTRTRPSSAALSQSQLSCLITSLHSRTYATGPLGKPQQPRGKKKPPNGGSNESSSPQNSSTGSENPQKSEAQPGTSQQGSGGGNDGKNGNDGQESKGPKNVLTEQQNKDIDLMIEATYSRLPKSMARDVVETLNSFRYKGVPPEFDDLVKILHNPNVSLKSMSTMMKFIRTLADEESQRDTERLVTKFERKPGQQESNHDKPLEEQRRSQAEEDSKSSKAMGETKEENNQNDSDKEIKDKSREQEKRRQKQKEKGQQNKKGKAQDDFDFKVFNIKLDANTIIVSTIVSYMLYRAVFPGEMSKDITWQEFRNTFFDKGLVEKLTVVNKNRVRVELHREAVANVYPESPASKPGFYYYFTIGSVEAFERRLDDAHQELGIPPSERIPVSYVEEVSWIGTILTTFAPTLLFIGAIALMSRRAGGGSGQSGIFGIGKSRAKRFNHESGVQTKFADVAGMDEAKVEIMEFVSFLKKPEQFRRLGAKIPRGAILSGPPGTGKTLLAKATAGESGVPFFSVSGSEFVEMFVGVGPSRVRDLFANARKNAPCIIFIDEIDAIGKSRAKSNMGGGNDERESTLNQILTEMDGFNTSEQVVVLAGTNRPDVLDKALMRPGRFDRHIAIDRPTMDGRKQIFAVHLKKIVTNEDMEYLKGRLAALTPGFSGADIANCVNEAALVAARGVSDSVTMKHFEQAIERVIGGLEKKSLVLSPEEKRTVAYHEAGHAICGWFFKHADPLLKVSIIPRGQGALGYAQYLPARGDTYLMDVHQLMDRMAMALGGRVSEELHFDTVTSGASDDFNKVTRMATAMVTKFGMSQKIGYIYFEEDQQQFHKPFSEETAKNIDMEVRRLVEEAYNKCRNLLIEKKKEVGIVAEELLSKEVLSRDDLIRLLGKRPFPEAGEFTKYFDGADGKGTIAPPPPTNEEGKSGPETS